MYMWLRDLALQQIRDAGPHTRVFVVHPNFVQQRILLPELLQNNTLYFKCDSDDRDRTQIQSRIDQTLALIQDAGKGRPYPNPG